MSVDRAKSDDIPELCELLAILFEQEAEFIPDFERQSRGLMEIIGNPNFGFIMVNRDENGSINGMVNILYTVSTAVGGRVAILEDMIVLPECRGESIGMRLLESVFDILKDEGIQRVTLLTDPHNLDAQRFYMRNGFGISDMKVMRNFIL